jgi:hypoxanthine phosphoribosyltransferase
MADKLYFSYEQIHQLVEELAPKILDTFQPEIIVGIGGGGFVPARILRSYLRIPFLAVGMRLYNDVTDQAEERIVKTQWFDDNCDPWKTLHCRRVLIVDEIDDSRRTLQFCAEQIMKDYAPSKVGIMVLHNKLKEKHGVIPEGVAYFCGKETAGDAWLVYPWESCDIRAHYAQCQNQNERGLSPKFLARCTWLCSLPDGWCDGKSRAINADLVNTCKELVSNLVTHGIPEPQLCPVEDGSIDLNWDAAQVFCTLHCQKFTFTKLHPSGYADKVIHIYKEQYTGVPDLSTIFIEHWNSNTD